MPEDPRAALRLKAREAAVGSAAAELEALIDARVQEKGSAVFAAMRARIQELEAENALLKDMMGIPAGTPLLVPVPDDGGPGDNDDPLDI